VTDRLFQDLSDEELVERYRRAGPPGEGVTRPEDTALEAEMRRRGLMPDREDTIPEDPATDLDDTEGPVDQIAPGESADADTTDEELPPDA
jgi:hypothetical protein